MPIPEIKLVTGQRFRCRCCGKCCRIWHVALSPGEVSVLRTRETTTGRGEDPVELIQGYPYVRHRPDGDCFYLDPTTNRCRLHQRYGAASKPLGCRIYPLNLTTAFPHAVSVGVRFDCPAIQDNEGESLENRRAEIREYVTELNLEGGFQSRDLDGLAPDSVRHLVTCFAEFTASCIGSPPNIHNDGMLQILHRIRKLEPDFMNDKETLPEIISGLMKRFREPLPDIYSYPLSGFQRGVFRIWLANYLRRDEEWLTGEGHGRLRRSWGLAKLFCGWGNWRLLSADLPDLSVVATGLFSDDFTKPLPAATDETWECYRRFLHHRLSSLQFFGPAYYGQPFFAGLQALLLTHPLVLAAARILARAEQREVLTAADVRLATGMIDHSFGRSPLLQYDLMRRFEHFFGAPKRHSALISALS